MNSTLPIGDLSRATHLSVKMLRHCHELGLLEPVDVDMDTGYRRYATEQIVTAQIIRRFRDLEMPLEDIQIALQAPDVETRNRVIANHLARLESSLARTQEAVTSLRELLDHPQASVPIDHRHLAATPATVITDIVDKADALAWSRLTRRRGSGPTAQMALFGAATAAARCRNAPSGFSTVTAKYPGGISGAPFLLSVVGMRRLSCLGAWIAADQERG